MLASISPVGEASRHQRWTVTVTAYLVASTLGGTAVGAIAGGGGWAVAQLTGPVPTALLVGVLAVVAFAGLAVDRGRLPFRLPSWQRQVDERWLASYRGWVYGAGFGFQLGAAVLTRVPTSAVHLTLAAAAASGSVATGAAVGAVFGAARAAPVLLTAPLRDPERLRRFHRRVDAASGVAERATGLVVASVTVVAFVGALAVG